MERSPTPDPEPRSPERGVSRAARRVSMHDVAARAGVTQKTVSRVVNNERHVSAATRDRVLAAIKELGFRPNAAARALVTQKSRRVGVVSVSMALHGPASTLDGVEQAARAAGYALSVVRTTENSADQLQNAIDQLVDQGVEGIILSEPMDFGHPRLEIPAGVVVVRLDLPSGERRPGEIAIGTDETEAARGATEHLLALGHRTVWHLAGPRNWASSHRRIAGWRTALSEAGAPEPEVVRGDWSARSGFDAARTLLARPDVTALFAANDQMAAGAVRAVQDAGLRVPADVSVVGFDDEPVAAYLTPPLTTVRQDFAELTRLAMHRLIRTIEGHPPADRRRAVPAQLMVRSSTGQANPDRVPVRAAPGPRPDPAPG